MIKIKYRYTLLLLPVLGLLSSCQPAAPEYTIVSGETAKSHLTVTTDSNFKTAYNNGDEFDSTGLSVVFDGVTLTRATDGEVGETQYFLSTNSADPVRSAFGSESRVNSSTRNQDVNFYVCYSLVDNDIGQIVYISDPLICHVTNNSVPDQWVTYLVLGVAIVAIAVYSTLRQKRIRDNRNKNIQAAKKSPLDEEIVAACDEFGKEPDEPTADKKARDEDSSDDEIK